jgi:ElaB/YqjD/DUF883 family membrane-anchored ribosome-binding protein
MTPYDDDDTNESSNNADWHLIREDLDKLRADLARLGEKSLAEGQGVLADELAQLRAKAASLASKVNESGRSAHDDLAGYVRDNPITSVGGAFGLGLLIAALFSRRS